MTRERLVWAIDCDDVVVPTAEVIINAYNERHGTSVELQHYYADFDEIWGVSSRTEGVGRIWDLVREGILDSVVPTEDTINALMRLASVDELHMVTGRQSFLEEMTHRMINTYLPGVFQTVEHTNYFSKEGSGFVSRSKGEVCSKIGADVLIDDHIAHGVSVLESGLEEVIVWGDYPWNRTRELPSGMMRCVMWEEVFLERERILASRT